jgi:Condensation domain/TubC N-terminal docking domain
MNLVNRAESSGRIADVLGAVRQKGVRLWAENGQLRFKAPKGALTQQEVERIQLSKEEIIALLEQATALGHAEPPLEPRADRTSAPLAFSQLAHWHLYQLSERPAFRSVACATRLRGLLDLDALERSLAFIVRRHEALRTQIILRDGVLTQHISEPADSPIEVDDLSAVPANEREEEIQGRVEEFIRRPIQVAKDPLLGLRLLRLAHNEHVLIVAMEHMISDGFSRNIFVRELLSAYRQAVQGQAFCLPEVPIQFADYAAWQRSAEAAWVEKHGRYWQERMCGCARQRFPADPLVAGNSRAGWGIVPLHIGKDLKGQLTEWCRIRRTTLVMSVFTAYAALVLRWCDVTDTVIQFEIDGRVSPKVQNTIGYFASALPLRIVLRDEDRLIDLLSRVMEEYCKALEHDDASYLEAQVPRPEYTRNSCFNWLPQGPKSEPVAQNEFKAALTATPVSLAPRPILKNIERDIEPMVGFIEREEEIGVLVQFPCSRFSEQTMERFGRNLLGFIRALLRYPEGRVKDLVLLQ